jgi:hypothetical protein
MSLKIHTFSKPDPLTLQEWTETKPLILYLLGTMVADNEAFFTDIYLAIKGLSYFYDLRRLNGSGLLVTKGHLTVTAEERDGYKEANFYVAMINPLIVHLQLTDKIETGHYSRDIEHLVDLIPYMTDRNGKPIHPFYELLPKDMSELTLTQWRLIVQERVMIGMHVDMDRYIKMYEAQPKPGPENNPSRRGMSQKFIKDP